MDDSLSDDVLRLLHLLEKKLDMEGSSVISLAITELASTYMVEFHEVVEAVVSKQESKLKVGKEEIDLVIIDRIIFQLLERDKSFKTVDVVHAYLMLGNAIFLPGKFKWALARYLNSLPHLTNRVVNVKGKSERVFVFTVPK